MERAQVESKYADFWLLQWCHRLSAMESCFRALMLKFSSSLQWCHRLSAMERGPGRDRGCWPPWLQWCHRLSAMESLGFDEAVGFVYDASMVPPPFGDGKLGDWQGGHRLHHASMVPPPFGDGKLGDWQGGHRLHHASMVPPPFGDGKGIALVLLGFPGQASMVPPPFGDGKRWVVIWTPTGTCWLQWCHRLSAMERWIAA